MEEALQFIRNVPVWMEQIKVYYWAIALKETNLLVGTICLFNLEDHPKRAEIGYELHPSFKGKGLMQEALDAVIRYGFDILDLQMITACLVPQNIASVKLLQRNHFRMDQDFRYTSKETAKDLCCYYLKRKGFKLPE
jgi:ribosomal-protein-alanine N-acetyltransferase